MVSRAFWLVISLFVFNNVKPQSNEDNIKIQIIDKVTQTPLAYCTVKSLDNKIACFTNLEGYFEISKTYNDSLFVSSIGYISQVITIKQIVNSIIYMMPNTYELPQVNVKNRIKIKDTISGLKSAKKNNVWTSGGYGEEFAQKIQFTEASKTYKLKKIKIAFARFDETIPTLLRIYSCGTNNFPAEDILNQKVLLTKKLYNKKRGQIEIDIDTLNIFISDKSCFIGIEWLPLNGDKIRPVPSSAISLTEDFNFSFSCVKSFLWGKNYWGPLLILPNQKNPFNLIISVEADIYN